MVSSKSPIVRWLGRLALVAILAWICSVFQGASKDEARIRRAQLQASVGADDIDWPAKIHDQLEHNTPWMLYGLLAWIALTLEQLVSNVSAKHEEH